ncbi:MAG TPA: hypothetical protein DCR55_09545 [Lentisphaeria bacterium]|nr:hypothetical protein [Lentisphaeria bacterium]
MGKDIVAIREDAHDIDARRTLRQPLEQGRQPLATFLGLRVVLDVLARIDDGNRIRIARFDAFEQGLDSFFSFYAHGYLRLDLLPYSHLNLGFDGPTLGDGCELRK